MACWNFQIPQTFQEILEPGWNTMKKSRRAMTAAIAIAIAIAAGAYVLAPKEVHEHADFAVFLDGEQLDFSHDRHMSDAAHLSERAHLHENNGSVVHKHAAGVTWGEFFSTLGMTLNSSCFAADDKNYCSNETHKLQMFVNGNEISDIENYIIMDLDRVLISVDTGDSIQQQLSKVTDFACVYSRRCPERGEAAGESCAAGGAQCE